MSPDALEASHERRRHIVRLCLQTPQTIDGIEAWFTAQTGDCEGIRTAVYNARKRGLIANNTGGRGGTGHKGLFSATEAGIELLGADEQARYSTKRWDATELVRAWAGVAPC